MSLALLSPKYKISTWLNMQLIELPKPAGDIVYHTTLMGQPRPLSSIKELLDSIINHNEWSFEIGQSLDDLAHYFPLDKGWWKDRKGMDLWLLDTIAATFADAWIYYQWLRENQPDIADAYLDFFSHSVMHPEWVKAIEAQWTHHPSVGGNLYDVLPDIGEYMNPPQLKSSVWYPSYKSKIGRELNRRSCNSWCWLKTVFTTPAKDRAQILEDGLKHVSLATIKGDTQFFTSLGKALSETYIPCELLSLEQIQDQPTSKAKGETTTRQWCRRIWLSRCLWMLPTHLLEQEPFSLSRTTISEMTGGRYKDGKERTQNDALYQIESPLFNELHTDTSSVSLTTEGRGMSLPLAENRLPWAIVSSDFMSPDKYS